MFSKLSHLEMSNDMCFDKFQQVRIILMSTSIHTLKYSFYTSEKLKMYAI